MRTVRQQLEIQPIGFAVLSYPEIESVFRVSFCSAGWPEENRDINVCSHPLTHRGKTHASSVLPLSLLPLRRAIRTLSRL